MSNREAEQNQIAKRYGTVFFRLAQEKKKLNPILKDIAQIQRSLQKDSFGWMLLRSPTISLRVQQDVIEKLSSSLKLENLTRQFLLVLCQNRRLQDLSFMLKAFIVQSIASEGVLEGVLETAEKLPPKAMDSLQKALKRQLGQSIVLQQEVKESLLAGAVLRMGSLMVDMSLKTQLHKIGQAMKG